MSLASVARQLSGLSAEKLRQSSTVADSQDATVGVASALSAKEIRSCSDNPDNDLRSHVTRARTHARTCTGEATVGVSGLSEAPRGYCLKFCRCCDCPLWSEWGCETGIRTRESNPKQWHYCLDYAGRRLSKEVFWWRE